MINLFQVLEFLFMFIYMGIFPTCMSVYCMYVRVHAEHKVSDPLELDLLR